MSVNTDYQNLIYLNQGATRLFVKNGASIEGESGVQFIAPTGFEFYLNGTTVSAQRMLVTLQSLHTVTVVAKSGATQLNYTTSIMSPAYGRHIISGSTGLSKISMHLPSARLGAVLIIDTVSYFVGDANMSIFAESGGGAVQCSLQNELGADCSSIEMSAVGKVTLICQVEGLWQVAELTSSVDVNPSA